MGLRKGVEGKREGNQLKQMIMKECEKHALGQGEPLVFKPRPGGEKPGGGNCVVQSRERKVGVFKGGRVMSKTFSAKDQKIDEKES